MKAVVLGVALAASVATISGCSPRTTRISQIKYISIIDDISISQTIEVYDTRCGTNISGPPHTTELSVGAAKYYNIEMNEIGKAIEKGRIDGLLLPCSADSQDKLLAEMRRINSLLEHAVKSDTAARRAQQAQAATQATYDRAYAECRYQADLALANTRGFVDRAVEGVSLIQQCMAMKGYQ